MDAELVVELGRLTSRVREQWQRYYPQLLQLSPAADDPWVWRLWEKAPTPAAGRRVRRKTVELILQAHRIRRWATDDVLGILDTPALPVAPGTSEAAVLHAGQLIARLDLVREQRAVCQQQLEALDRAHWLRSIAWVPQRPHLPWGTVADAIRSGRRDATAVEVAEAARVAGADGFIRELPQGYDTHLGEGGRRTISQVTPSFVHNTIDNPIFPTTGRRYTANIDIAGLGGNVNFLKPRLEGVWARFPYLHNGSVPNVAALLSRPDDRPRAFSLRRPPRCTPPPRARPGPGRWLPARCAPAGDPRRSTRGRRR